MENINKFLGRNPKYVRLSKPLQAARVCDTARSLADGRFSTLSFKDGLLTLGVKSPSEAANLQMESAAFIKSLNDKLGQELVQRLRFKIV